MGFRDWLIGSREAVISIKNQATRLFKKMVEYGLGEDLYDEFIGGSREAPVISGSIDSTPSSKEKSSSKRLMISKGDRLGILPTMVTLPKHSDDASHAAIIDHILKSAGREPYQWIKYVMGADELLTLADHVHSKIRKPFSLQLIPKLYVDVIRQLEEKSPGKYSYSTRVKKAFYRNLIGFDIDDELLDALKAVEQLMISSPLVFRVPPWSVWMLPSVRQCQSEIDFACMTFIFKYKEQVRRLIVNNASSMFTLAVKDFLYRYGRVSKESTKALLSVFDDLDRQELIFLINDRQVRSCLTALFPVINLLRIIDSVRSLASPNSFDGVVCRAMARTLMDHSSANSIRELPSRSQKALSLLADNAISSASSFRAIFRYTKRAITIPGDEVIPAHSVIRMDLVSLFDSTKLDFSLYINLYDTKEAGLSKIDGKRPLLQAGNLGLEFILPSRQSFIYLHDRFIENLGLKHGLCQFNSLPHEVKAGLIARLNIREEMVMELLDCIEPSISSLSFGRGRRACVGKALAHKLVRVGLFESMKTLKEKPIDDEYWIRSLPLSR